jgi:helix-turn-helix protein
MSPSLHDFHGACCSFDVSGSDNYDDGMGQRAEPAERPTGDKLLRAACADTLRKWRASQGNLDQAALSRKAGLPHHAVGSLERGQRAINLKEIVQICRSLEVAVPTFLKDVHQALLAAVEPLLVQGLRVGRGEPQSARDELSRAADLVSERAQELLSSLAALGEEPGKAPSPRGAGSEEL